VEPLQIAPERLQTISGRRLEIEKELRGVQHIELP
jgi:hypothetical protein